MPAKRAPSRQFIAARDKTRHFAEFCTPEVFCKSASILQNRCWNGARGAVSTLSATAPEAPFSSRSGWPQFALANYGMGLKFAVQI